MGLGQISQGQYWDKTYPGTSGHDSSDLQNSTKKLKIHQFSIAAYSLPYSKTKLTEGYKIISKRILNFFVRVHFGPYAKRVQFQVLQY